MGMTSVWHWLVVLVIVILIFGTKKLRNVGKDLGTAVHDFKEGLNDSDNKTEKKIEDTAAEAKTDDHKSA